jgi:O-antigen ligase/tetratricopeptide (TPR) repeat protein
MKNMKTKANQKQVTSQNDYFNSVTLFFIGAYMIIDFFPQFHCFEIIEPQFLYLAFLNIVVVLFFYYNPNSIPSSLATLLKDSLIVKGYFVFLFFCGLSVLAARNFSLWVISFMHLVIVFGVFLNLSILLYNKQQLLNKVILLVCISSFLQSFIQLYDFIKLANANSIVAALDNLKGNTGNINVFAASLGIKIPFILLGIIKFTKQSKWFAALSLFLAITSLLLTSSRASFIGLCLVITVFVFGYLRINGLKTVVFKDITVVVLLAVSSFLVVNITFKSAKGTGRYESVTSRVGQITNRADGSASARLMYWSNGLKMIKDKPLLGIGLGNWKMESLPYEKYQIDDSHISGHAHDDFIEIMSETGVVNGLLYFSFFVFLFVQNVKRLLKSNVHTMQTIALLSLMLLMAYGVDAVFNFPLYRPTMQLYFCFCIAFTVINCAFEINIEKGLVYKNLKIIAIVVFAFAAFFAFTSFKASQLENKIIVDKTVTGQDIINELPRFPNLGVYTEAFVEFAAVKFYEEKNYPQALRYFSHSQKISPYLGIAEYYKHFIALEKGKVDSSYLYIKKAFEKRPRNQGYFLSVLHIAVIKKDTVEMMKAFSTFSTYRKQAVNWIDASNALFKAKYNTTKLIHFIDDGLMVFPEDASLLRQKIFFQNNKNVFVVNKYILQAQEYHKNKQYALALPIYTKLTVLEPENPIRIQDIGVCYYNLKQYNNAITAFKKSILLKGSADGKSEYLIGVCYLNLQDKSNGCKYLNLAKTKNYPNTDSLLQVYCK